MSKRQAAKALAKSQCFRVFPLGINSKLPAFTGDWQQIATRDPAAIDRLWTCPVFGDELDYNIGVALDPDTLVVDVDVREGKRGAESLQLLEALYESMPDTYCVTTASGGQHFYFRAENSGAFAAHLAEHIDLKGEGGYVVGEGSAIEGRAYAPAGGGDTAPAPSPQWIRDIAPAQGRAHRDVMGAERRPVVELDTASAIARATEYLKSAPTHGTYQRAARVKDFGISREQCLALMIEHWPTDKDDDHIAFRVDNAYRYGQNAPGVASAEAEFDAVETLEGDKKPQKPTRGLYAVRWADAIPELDRPYLIDDIYDLGAMVVTYGDSNVGKTYVVLDQCAAVAGGSDWNGHKTQQGLVVYVAGEGGRGFFKRIEAYRRARRLAALPFALVPCPIDLHATGDSNDTDRLIRLVRAEEAHFGQKCVLVVIDTLARAMGAGDENTSVDMGLLVRHCDRLRAALGATVNLIHHTGKDKAKGARGSSALRAATDTEIEVDEGRLTVQKQRDMARVKEKRFRLDEVEIGRRSDGRAVTACVVEWVKETEFEVRLTADAEDMLEVFDELVEAALEADPDRDKRDIYIPWDTWQMSALSRFSVTKGRVTGRTYLFKVRRELVTAGLVTQNKQKQWVRQISHQSHQLSPPVTNRSG